MQLFVSTKMFDPIKPFYDLPQLPPKQSLESIEVYKALLPASEALARLSATAQHLPNQAALYESVILLEAKASSEIEHVVTTDARLFGSPSSEHAIDPMTKEVHRYAAAMRYGWTNGKPICVPVLEKMCSIIRDKPVEVRRVPGTALKNSSGEIIYIPPDREVLLRDLLTNMLNWMNEKGGVHPIIKAAIAHYQFESIHPFTDGNARTGRIMVVLYLVEQGLLQAPVLFLSGEILRTREIYYSFLQSIHETQDFIPYLIWFIQLVHIAAMRSETRALKLRVAMQYVKNEIRSQEPKMYSQNLVNSLFRGPIVYAYQLVDHNVVGSLSTAHSYLKRLSEMGLLVKSDKRFSRKVGYINSSLLEALRDEIDLT